MTGYPLTRRQKAVQVVIIAVMVTVPVSCSVYVGWWFMAPLAVAFFFVLVSFIGGIVQLIREKKN